MKLSYNKMLIVDVDETVPVGFTYVAIICLASEEINYHFI